MNDVLQRFMVNDKAIRGAIVHMQDSYQEILKRHPYPLAIKKLLGEILSITALLGASMKNEATLNLQIQYEGPIKLLVAQCNNRLQVRGLAQWEGDVETASFEQLLGQGRLAMTFMPKNGKQYQSIVPLNETTLANSITTYFNQSEQIPTAIYLVATEERVVGILLQSLPDDAREKNPLESYLDVIKKIPTEIMLTTRNEQLLQNIFSDQTIQIFDSRTVEFHCQCNIPKMENAIALYNREELDEILQLDKWVSVTCEFCNQTYNFDRADVDEILNRQPPQNNSQH